LFGFEFGCYDVDVFGISYFVGDSLSLGYLESGRWEMKKIIQKHHLIYPSEKHKQPEEVVKIWKGEHFILTRLGWMKKISKGFVKSLKLWILLNEDKAEELE